MRLAIKGDNLWAFLLVVFALFCCAGCSSGESGNAKPTDTLYSGKILISVDESFKPVMDEFVKVYQSNYPGSEIEIRYKPEAECLKDFFVDSVRIVVATRGYTPGERSHIVDSFKVIPKKMIVARDAVAVIVHPDAQESLFTMQEIEQILTGTYKKKLIPVFDGLKATSTVRYIMDSVLKGKPLWPGTKGADSSEAVIDYVSKHKDAVGFIGVSWVADKDDSLQIGFLKKIKIAQLESLDKKNSYILPVQANIYYRRYPMVRDLIYTIKENHQGLGKGFVGFMVGEKGQLLFKQSYLMPAQLRLGIRRIRVYE